MNEKKSAIIRDQVMRISRKVGADFAATWARVSRDRYSSGFTGAEALKQVGILADRKPKLAVVDCGYRGHGVEPDMHHFRHADDLGRRLEIAKGERWAMTR
ncbi:hypothetical protein [Allgaiera indica]|uniref:hypothetical protein n=1 Tax=Allgaiera indica TaxID=765699 RepID=UPI00115FD7F5|nr:hypothetical protein [Allgaiera indica]